MDRDTLGYKPVFDEAERQSELVSYSQFYPTFRDHPELFHFIMAGGDQKYVSEVASIEQAVLLDPEFAHAMLEKGPSTAGGGLDILDCVESRHILMMTYLHSLLGNNWGHVIEIGGGYGNCLRLISGLVDYYRWTILDMQYVLGLQSWFLEAEGVDTSKVDFGISAYNSLDLVIGTHSLSEFAMETFISYYPIIKSTKWLFYVCHRHNPSSVLLKNKRDMIEQDFILHSSMEYEAGESIMYLYKLK